MEHYLWFIEAKNCKVKIFIFFSLKWTSCEVREGGQPERWNVYWNKVIREFRAEEHFVMSGQKVSILSPTFGRANGTDKHLFTRNPSIQRSRQRNYLGFFENRPEKENVTLVLSLVVDRQNSNLCFNLRAGTKFAEQFWEVMNLFRFLDTVFRQFVALMLYNKGGEKPHPSHQCWLVQLMHRCMETHRPY